MRRLRRIPRCEGRVSVCDYRWPLLDPNEEDRRNGITHAWPC
jgi:hypothetical protein